MHIRSMKQREIFMMSTLSPLTMALGLRLPHLCRWTFSVVITEHYISFLLSNFVIQSQSYTTVLIASSCDIIVHSLDHSISHFCILFGDEFCLELINNRVESVSWLISWFLHPIWLHRCLLSTMLSRVRVPVRVRVRVGIRVVSLQRKFHLVILLRVFFTRETWIYTVFQHHWLEWIPLSHRCKLIVSWSRLILTLPCRHMWGSLFPIVRNPGRSHQALWCGRVLFFKWHNRNLIFLQLI